MSTVVSILFIFCSNTGYTQHTAQHFNNDVRAYFLARLHQTETDRLLVPFEHSHKIRIKDISKKKAAFWQLYKEVVNKEVPLTAPVSASAHEFPVRHRNLIKEDPMPFYYFFKG